MSKQVRKAAVAAGAGSEPLLRRSNKGDQGVGRFASENGLKFYAYIYRHNNVPVYVGKGSGNRSHSHLRRHRGRAISAFHKFINALPNFSSIEIEKIFSEDEQSALALEKALVEKFRADGFRLLNVLEGGRQPPNQRGVRFPRRQSPTTKGTPSGRWPEERKIAHGILMRAIMRSEEVRNRISKSKQGKPGHRHTKASKAKISKAHKGIRSERKSESKRGALNPVLGWKWFNNGNSQRLFAPESAPPGWKLGRIKLK